MAFTLRAAGVVSIVAGMAACGGELSGVSSEAIQAPSEEYGSRAPSALQNPAPVRVAARLEPHRKVVMRSMRVHVVYVGRQREDGDAAFDPLVRWLLGSAHWGLLAEYGVGPGAFVDSVNVPTEEFFGEGSVVDGVIDSAALEELARVRMTRSALDGDIPRSGADAELVAGAEGYVFFLPNGVNAAIGTRGSYTFKTCVDALGYHRFNGREPYAVIGGCESGRTGFVVSHEIAEMATDPIVGQGWFSGEDLSKSGGEVADLCLAKGAARIEGWSVTRLWSNARGDCFPR